MARKRKTLRFLLTEEDDLVSAVLSIDGARILDFENEESPSVTVRHPIARAGELLNHATYWSKRNPRTDVSDWLSDYIGSREKELVKEVLAIRKSLRKIAGIMRNANTGKRLIKESRS